MCCDFLQVFKENILLDKKSQSVFDYFNTEENKFHDIQV